MVSKRITLFGKWILLAVAAGLLLALLWAGGSLWLRMTQAAIEAGYYSIGLPGCGISFNALPGMFLGKFEGMEVENPGPAPDFTLTDYRGDAFRLEDQKGKIVFLYFGYTMCPDACPTTLLDYRRTREALGPTADDKVIWVFITIDPERDTPEVMRRYMETRGEEAFFMLSGSMEALQAVYADYDIFVERVESQESSVGYLMNHTALSYVVDTRGDLRLAHPFGMNYKSMLHDVNLLLEEDRRK